MKTLVALLAVWLSVVWPVAAQKSKAPARPSLEQRAAKVLLPNLEELDEMKRGTAREALEYLAKRSRELDPAGKGINVILKLDVHPDEPADQAEPAKDIPGLPAPVPAPGGTRLGIPLLNVPLTEALKYVANLANLTIRWDEHAVVLLAVKPGKEGKPPARPKLKVAAGVPKAVTAKLNKIVLPKVDFKDSTAREAFDFIAQRARTLDPDSATVGAILSLDGGEEKPAEKWVLNRVVKVTGRPGEKGGAARVTLSATDLPLIEVYRYVAELSNLEIAIEK